MDEGCRARYWWFNFYRPEGWLARESAIKLVLKGTSVFEMVGSVVIPLDEKWRERIGRAPQSRMKGHWTIKVVVCQKKPDGEFTVYFGKAACGAYPVKLQTE